MSNTFYIFTRRETAPTEGERSTDGKAQNHLVEGSVGRLHLIELAGQFLWL